MALITDQSTLFSLTHSIDYHAQYSGSWGNQDFTAVNYTTNINIVTVNPIVGLTLGFNTYFKMTGYNAGTQQWENWHSMNSPLLTPPSGNSLDDISVVTSWIDR